MNELLRASAANYLRLRKIRGYQPGDQVWLLRDYIDYLDAHGFTAITVDNAVAWACLPANSHSRWHAERLAVLRKFAGHLHASTPDAAELIPTGILPSRVVRVAPFLYSSTQVETLISQACTLRPTLMGQTLSTVIGLMAATGMRTTEALSLNTTDIDSELATIVVWGKGGRQRVLPVQTSTLSALAQYITTSRAIMKPSDNALFLSPAGSRPLANTIQQAFRRVATACQLPLSLGQRKPRLHDLRH